MDGADGQVLAALQIGTLSNDLSWGYLILRHAYENGSSNCILLC